MEWKHQRRLVLTMAGDWQGWTCDTCDWRLRFPEGAAGRGAQSKSIQCEFDAHDCTQFVRQKCKPKS